MSKIEINVVAASLKKHAVEPAVLRSIIEELQFEAQPEPGEEKLPAVKKQFCIVVSDPEGRMPTCDLVGWIVQIPESESPATTLDRINRASYDYNQSKRGMHLPVKTHGEAIEVVPAKFLKESDVWVKTRTPVLILKTNNEIPRETSSIG